MPTAAKNMPQAGDPGRELFFSMDRNLALEVVRVTESAALAASLYVGRGDEKGADQAAVDAMRTVLNTLNIDGRVVIGEGERDEAPMLYIGEKVGTGNGPKIDSALDPLEGTAITANGGMNALAVIAMTEEGGFLNAPDTYMQKIAVGPGLPDNFLDIDEPADDFVRRLAKFKGASPEQLMICVLDRPRHDDTIRLIRKTGARITLIQDGDVSAVIATAEDHSPIDAYMGIGGAPEGVLAAAAVHTHLVRKGLRSYASINVRCAEAVDTHYFAVLIGVGATTVNAYLAEASIADRHARGLFGDLSLDACFERYRTAINEGLLKIMSKMGIAVISSYRGGYNFEAVGLSRALVNDLFPGMPAKISGEGYASLHYSAMLRHEQAFDSAVVRLPIGGFYRQRDGGAAHAYSAPLRHLLPTAVGTAR